MSTPALSAGPALTITMNDSGVVFSGASNVYRYDQPGAAEVAHHVRSVLGDNPAGAVVHFVADDADVDELERALTGYDVTLTAESPSDISAGPGEHTEILHIERPAADRRGGAGPGARDGWIVGAAVLVIAAVAAAAVWFTLRARAEEPAAAAVPPSAASSASSAPASSAPPTSSAAASPPGVVVERGGLRVELPAGYTVKPDGDMWRATGEDPEFRIQIAVEDLFHLPPEQMAEQVVADIEADPEVELVSREGAVVHYAQTGRDGSKTQWKTWADGGHQLFVGCHSRWDPTNVQRATCRMAMDSAGFDPEAAQAKNF